MCDSPVAPTAVCGTVQALTRLSSYSSSDEKLMRGVLLEIATELPCFGAFRIVLQASPPSDLWRVVSGTVDELLPLNSPPITFVRLYAAALPLSTPSTVGIDSAAKVICRLIDGRHYRAALVLLHAFPLRAVHLHHIIMRLLAPPGTGTNRCSCRLQLRHINAIAAACLQRLLMTGASQAHWRYAAIRAAAAGLPSVVAALFAVAGRHHGADAAAEALANTHNNCTSCVQAPDTCACAIDEVDQEFACSPSCTDVFRVAACLSHSNGCLHTSPATLLAMASVPVLHSTPLHYVTAVRDGPATRDVMCYCGSDCDCACTCEDPFAPHTAPAVTSLPETRDARDDGDVTCAAWCAPSSTCYDVLRDVARARADVVEQARHGHVGNSCAAALVDRATSADAPASPDNHTGEGSDLSVCGVGGGAVEGKGDAPGGAPAASPGCRLPPPQTNRPADGFRKAPIGIDADGAAPTMVTRAIAALLAAGADPMAPRGYDGATPLGVAVATGHPAVAVALLRASCACAYEGVCICSGRLAGRCGAACADVCRNPVATTQCDCGPYCRGGYCESRRRRPKIQPPSLLVLAARSKSVEMLRTIATTFPALLIECAARRALVAAVEAKDAPMVAELLAFGVGPNVWTEGGDAVLTTAATTAQKDIVVQLLRAGACVDARSATGATALLRAAYLADCETIRILLDAGADVNAVSPTAGTNAVVRSALVGGYDAVAMMLRAGASVNVRAYGDMRACDVVATMRENNLVKRRDTSALDATLSAVHAAAQREGVSCTLEAICDAVVPAAVAR